MDKGRGQRRWPLIRDQCIPVCHSNSHHQGNGLSEREFGGGCSNGRQGDSRRAPVRRGLVKSDNSHRNILAQLFFKFNDISKLLYYLIPSTEIAVSAGNFFFTGQILFVPVSIYYLFKSLHSHSQSAKKWSKELRLGWARQQTLSFPTSPIFDPAPH